MLNQTFDAKTLLKLTTKRDIINFELGRNTTEYNNSLEKVASHINSTMFSFDSLRFYSYKGKSVYTIDSVAEHYALKKISDNIRRIYKIKFSSKDEIVNQVVNILADTSSYNIIRLDVKDFFERINFSEIILKLESDNILSESSLKILKKLKNKLPPDFIGVPRGLSISSVLSEIFMEEIDANIRSIKSVYFYARYVDDIIIISHSNEVSIQLFERIFSKKELSLNEKTSHIKVPVINQIDKELDFSFLGYHYAIHSDTQSDGLRRLTIDISSTKLNKIKTRIIKSVLSYSQDHDDSLLINRMKFLSGNYVVSIDRNNRKVYSEDDSSTLRGGIFYNNKLINTKKNLSSLNKFLQCLLFCRKKNSIGSAVSKIPVSLRRNLISCCFISGHRYAICHDFTAENIKKIKECWR